MCVSLFVSCSGGEGSVTPCEAGTFNSEHGAINSTACQVMRGTIEMGREICSIEME